MPSQHSDHRKKAAHRPQHRCQARPSAGGAWAHHHGEYGDHHQAGHQKNGNLLYTLVPMHEVTQAYYDRQFAKADLAAAQQKAKVKAEKLGIEFIPAEDGQSA